MFNKNTFYKYQLAPYGMNTQRKTRKDTESAK